MYMCTDITPFCLFMYIIYSFMHVRAFLTASEVFLFMCLLQSRTNRRLRENLKCLLDGTCTTTKTIT